MNLLELQTIVNDLVGRQTNRHRNPEEVNVCIPIKTVNAIGGTPCVDVKSILIGFDWDSNKLMIYPVEDLSRTDHDYLANMRKQADELGWSVYEFTNLKRENKKLLKKIETLQEMLELLGGNE